MPPSAEQVAKLHSAEHCSTAKALLNWVFLLYHNNKEIARPNFYIFNIIPHINKFRKIISQDILRHLLDIIGYLKTSYRHYTT